MEPAIPRSGKDLLARPQANSRSAPGLTPIDPLLARDNLGGHQGRPSSPRGARSMAEVPSRSNSVSAMARSMPTQPGAVREIKVRQVSAFFDEAIASLDREARAKNLDYRSWDLGIIRL